METTLGDGQAPSLPSWSQSELASAQSGPQQIPPEMHNKVFSWVEVRDIVGTCSCSKERFSYPERAPFPYTDSRIQIVYLYRYYGPENGYRAFQNPEAK